MSDTDLEARFAPLAALAGDWRGEETLFATAWGPGGLAAAEVSARVALGGRALVQDYREERDGRPALTAHAVFTLGAEGGYQLYWFDSYGFQPSAPAAGQRDGDAITFLRVSPRGQTRHSYVLVDERTYRHTLESSFDGGQSFVPVLTGLYRRR